MKWKEKVTKVYLINLDEMPDRLVVSNKILLDAGIEYMRWPATKDEEGVKGLILTMKALFNYILTYTYDFHFIILEDDCKFLLPINEFLNMLVEQLPEDYDMLMLGCNLTSRPERYSENLLRVNTSYCTQAIVYNRKVVEKILPLLDHIEPYDIKLMKNIQIFGKTYCTFPMFCEQFSGYSSIEKGSMDWAAFQRLTYASYTRGI